VDILIRQIFEGHDIQHLPRIFPVVDIQGSFVHPTKYPVSMDIHRTKHTLDGLPNPGLWGSFEGILHLPTPSRLTLKNRQVVEGILHLPTPSRLTLTNGQVDGLPNPGL